MNLNDECKMMSDERSVIINENGTTNELLTSMDKGQSVSICVHPWLIFQGITHVPSHTTKDEKGFANG